jgi:hypothetical protein
MGRPGSRAGAPGRAKLRPMQRPRLIVAAAVLLMAAGSPLVAAGCQGLPPIELCGEIPTGGCPIGLGGSCTDITCTGLYDCTGGLWILVQTCPPQPDGGGAGGGGAGGGMVDGGDAGEAPDACTPVHIDLTGETTDCMPDLENPDCPVEAALGCAESACLTGCSDFFLCTVNGWVDVAYCTCELQLVVTQLDGGP